MEATLRNAHGDADFTVILRTGLFGMQYALVKLLQRHANKLLEKRRILIGWVSCPIRQRAEVRRCYKCYKVAKCNRRMKILKQDTNNEGFVWIEIGNVRYYSCYFSPNETKEEFSRKLGMLATNIRSAKKDVIVTGDFNAKSPEWGERRLDDRGELVGEVIVQCDLFVLNRGRKPTCLCYHGMTGSIIDLTIANESAAAKIKDWMVLDLATLSDHKYIRFDLGTAEKRVKQKKAKRWNSKKIDEEKMREALLEQVATLELEAAWKEGRNNSIEERVRLLRKTLQIACDRSTTKTTGPRVKSNYWWNDDIAEKRRLATRAWRVSARSKGNEDLRREYFQKKKDLRKAIQKSQVSSWKSLIRQLDDDPWGLAYKIAFKKLRHAQEIPELNDETFVGKIIEDLFPRREEWRRRRDEAWKLDDSDWFTERELTEEAKKLKNSKSPGPDGVPNEAVKKMALWCPGLLLGTFNRCLEEGTFPQE